VVLAVHLKNGEIKMRNKQNMSSKFSTKLSLNALSICFLSLMVLPTHAEEKTAADIAKATITAAMAAVSNDKSITPEVVVVEIPTDIKAAAEKMLLSKIEIKKHEMDDEASKVFSAQIYTVRPVIGNIALVDGEVLDLNNPGSESTLPGFLKLIKNDFVLDSEEKVSQLANAFHQASFPYKFKKIVKLVKVNHGWIVPLGKFFKKYSGLVFTTDKKEKITLVEFVLSINPKDYSYEFNKQNRDMGDLLQGVKQLN